MTYENHLRAARQQHRGLLARQRIDRPQGGQAFDNSDDDDDDDSLLEDLFGTLKPRPSKDAPETTRTVVRPPVRTTIPLQVPPVVTPVIPPRPTTIGPVLPSITNSSTSLSISSTPTTTSTSTTSTPTTTTTSSVVTTSKSPVPPPSPVTNNRDVSTTTASNVAASASQSTGSGAVSTGALAGGIGGGIVGVAALAFIVFFFVRRWRKKSADRDAFNATHFRRSGIQLDDPPAMSNANPRPPSMVERRMAAPAPPPASYPYDDQPQYSHMQYNGGHAGRQYGDAGYGHDNEFQYSGDQYSAYGQPGAYAAYGAPPTHTPHPQYPQQQQQQQFPQQYSFSPGQIVPVQRTSPPAPKPANLPNPFAPATTTTASAALAAARAASETPIHTAQTAPSVQPASSPYLSRQPTQVDGAPPAYKDEARYTEVQRDVKVAPLTVTNASPTSPSPRTPIAGAEANKRPLSSHTIYDPEDAYGGI